MDVMLPDCMSKKTGDVLRWMMQYLDTSPEDSLEVCGGVCGGATCKRGLKYILRFDGTMMVRGSGARHGMWAKVEWWTVCGDVDRLEDDMAGMCEITMEKKEN